MKIYILNLVVEHSQSTYWYEDIIPLVVSKNKKKLKKIVEKLKVEHEPCRNDTLFGVSFSKDSLSPSFNQVAFKKYKTMGKYGKELLKHPTGDIKFRITKVKKA